MTVQDDVVFIHGLIPEYPGYGDEDGLLQTDRLVRAWVGSSLAALRERLAAKLDAPTLEALDALIFRCQFPDQRYIAALEHAHLDESVKAHLTRLDRKELELAQKAPSVDAAGTSGLVAELDATFDERTPVSA